MRIVVKVGTSTLAYPTGLLNIRRVEELCRVLSDLKNAGHEVVLISSGAIGMGISPHWSWPLVLISIGVLWVEIISSAKSSALPHSEECSTPTFLGKSKCAINVNTPDIDAIPIFVQYSCIIFILSILLALAISCTLHR